MTSDRKWKRGPRLTPGLKCSGSKPLTLLWDITTPRRAQSASPGMPTHQTLPNFKTVPVSKPHLHAFLASACILGPIRLITKGKHCAVPSDVTHDVKLFRSRCLCPVYVRGADKHPQGWDCRNIPTGCGGCEGRQLGVPLASPLAL
jgi:hypothetical protein